jgi:osmoprotectant transport system permease protein
VALPHVIAANTAESWIWWDWVGRHTDDIWDATRQHVELTAIAVGIGFLISLPLAVAAWRWRRLESVVLTAGGLLYTIPSLALFALLIPWTGLSQRTALVGLTSYTLLILVRNILAGLDAVPADVREAARGMGFTSRGQLLRVDLPLAVPAMIAGIRIATVSTIGLVTVSFVLGLGGLGSLIYDGLTRQFRTPLVIGAAGCIALAVTADVLLLGVERLVTPWARRRAG